MKQTRYVTYAVCGLLIALLAVTASADLEYVLREIAKYLAAVEYMGEEDFEELERALADAVDNNVLSSKTSKQLLFVLAQKCHASEGFRGRLPAIIELLKMGKVAQNQWGFPVAELAQRLVLPPKKGGGGGTCVGPGLCSGISTQWACEMAGCTWVP